MFQNIYKQLKENGFNVYSVGQHNGLCEEPYIVIREGGDIPYSNLQITYSIIDIIVFYPIGRYSEVFGYVKSVREALKEIKELKCSDEVTALVVDHEVKAYTCGVKYQIFKRRS